MAWNRPSVEAKAVGRGKKHNPAVLYGGIVALLALVVVVAWFVLFRDPASPSHEDSAAKAREIKSAKPLKKPRQQPKRREVVKTGDKVKDALAEVEATGELVKISAPPKRDVTPTNSRANRFYKNGVEQLLNWVAATVPGDMPMPMPFLGDEDRADLVNILSIPCSIGKDDEDDLKSLKESVNYGKKEMANFVADGGDPDDFFGYYFEQLKQAYETHNEAQTSYLRLIEEDPDLAPEFRTKVNEMLSQKGIKPIEPDSDIEPEEYAKLHPEEKNDPAP